MQASLAGQCRSNPQNGQILGGTRKCFISVRTTNHMTTDPKWTQRNPRKLPGPLHLRFPKPPSKGEYPCYSPEFAPGIRPIRLFAEGNSPGNSGHSPLSDANSPGNSGHFGAIQDACCHFPVPPAVPHGSIPWALCMNYAYLGVPGPPSGNMLQGG